MLPSKNRVIAWPLDYEHKVSPEKLGKNFSNKYRLHHDVGVGMGFTQLRAKGPRTV